MRNKQRNLKTDNEFSVCFVVDVDGHQKKTIQL